MYIYTIHILKFVVGEYLISYISACQQMLPDSSAVSNQGFSARASYPVIT